MNRFLMAVALFFFGVVFSLTSYSLILPPVVLAEENYNSTWFTQGLFIEGDTFFISSGQYGRSKVIIQSPNKQLTYSLPSRYFAEGLTVVNDRIFLLTWRENTLFIFDRHSLKKLDIRNYEGEGWGLTHSDKHLIMSNGSNKIYFRHLESFELEKTLAIKNLDRLNELEYVNGTIWANRWYDDRIYAIDASSGCVKGSIDLSEVRKQGAEPGRDNITNGIAFDPVRKALWVTGKHWSKRFLIQLPDLEERGCL